MSPDILVDLNPERFIEDSKVWWKGYVVINGVFIEWRYNENEHEYEVQFSKDGIELSYKRPNLNKNMRDLVLEAATYFWSK